MGVVLESELKKMWNLLHLEGYALEVRAIKPEGGAFEKPTLVFKYSELLQWARKWAGKAHCYVGLNPRDENRKVVCLKTISIDVDSLHGKEAATESQLRSAYGVVEDFTKHYPGGSILSSGNGYHVIYSLPSPITDNVTAFEVLHSKFNREIAEKYKSEVRIDDLHDAPRMDRLAGVPNVKAGGRIARFLTVQHHSDSVPGIFDAIRKVVTVNPKADEAVNGALPIGKQGGTESISGSGTTEGLRSSGVEVGRVTLVPHGQRHTYLVGVAGALRRRGLGEDSIFRSLRETCNEVCSDGSMVPDKNLRVMAASVMKYEPEAVPNNERLGSVIANPGNGPEPLDERFLSVPSNSMDRYRNELKRRSNHREPEITTGFKKLDYLMDGFPKGDITTVGAYTKGGKSSLLVNFARPNLAKGKKGLFLSTEMNATQIQDKFFSLGAGIDYRSLRKGSLNDEEMAKFQHYEKEWTSYNMLLDDNLGPNEEYVKRRVEAFRPDFLIFDHIHQVGATSPDKFFVLSKFVEGMKQIARDYNVAVIMASQFKRPFVSRDKAGDITAMPKPSPFDFKGCGDIENKSATALLLYDAGQDIDIDVHQMVADVALCRHGERGQSLLSWAWKKNLFMEMDQ